MPRQWRIPWSGRLCGKIPTETGRSQTSRSSQYDLLKYRSSPVAWDSSQTPTDRVRTTCNQLLLIGIDSGRPTLSTEMKRQGNRGGISRSQVPFPRWKLLGNIKDQLHHYTKLDFPATPLMLKARSHCQWGGLCWSITSWRFLHHDTKLLLLVINPRDASLTPAVGPPYRNSSATSIAANHSLLRSSTHMFSRGPNNPTFPENMFPSVQTLRHLTLTLRSIPTNAITNLSPTYTVASRGFPFEERVEQPENHAQDALYAV